MKYMFGLLVIPGLCACVSQQKNTPLQDNSHLAKVVNDPDRVLVLAVNRKANEADSLMVTIESPEKYSAYLAPGLNRFTIQYSYKGFLATADDKASIEAFATPRIEEICVNLSAGVEYKISSEIFSGAPDVRRKSTNSKYVPVELSDCTAKI